MSVFLNKRRRRGDERPRARERRRVELLPSAQIVDGEKRVNERNANDERDKRRADPRHTFFSVDFDARLRSLIVGGTDDFDLEQEARERADLLARFCRLASTDCRPARSRVAVDASCEIGDRDNERAPKFHARAGARAAFVILKRQIFVYVRACAKCLWRHFEAKMHYDRPSMIFCSDW